MDAQCNLFRHNDVFICGPCSYCFQDPFWGPVSGVFRFLCKVCLLLHSENHDDVQNGSGVHFVQGLIIFISELCFYQLQGIIGVPSQAASKLYLVQTANAKKSFNARPGQLQGVLKLTESCQIRTETILDRLETTLDRPSMRLKDVKGLIEELQRSNMTVPQPKGASIRP